MWSSTIIPILQRKKRTQREVKWLARGGTAPKCPSWDVMHACCEDMKADPASSLGIHCAPLRFHNVWKHVNQP